MKRAMDGDSLKLALDHATEMLRELRVISFLNIIDLIKLIFIIYYV